MGAGLPARSVILRPVVSEKSYGLIDIDAYTFVVPRSATKVEIRNAVQEIFGVKVLSVNTLNRPGKTKRTRNQIGTRAQSKRAIVKLAAGDKIELFETR